MSKLGLFLMSIEILLFVITGADIISIVISIIEKIFSVNLNSQFFSSIVFRGCLVISRVSSNNMGLNGVDRWYFVQKNYKS